MEETAPEEGTEQKLAAAVGYDPNMTTEQRVDYSLDVLGVKMMGAPNREWADYGRQQTGRTMPV